MPFHVRALWAAVVAQRHQRHCGMGQMPQGSGPESCQVPMSLFGSGMVFAASQPMGPLGRYLLCTNTEERHKRKGPGWYEHQCRAMGLPSSEDLETLLGPDGLLPVAIHGISVTWLILIVKLDLDKNQKNSIN